jgi:hypothetical protein
MQLKLRKHPNAYIAIKWNLNLLVITFSTTLTPLARVVSRNDASPSDILMLLIKKQLTWKLPIYWYLMSFFHKKMSQNLWATIICHLDQWLEYFAVASSSNTKTPKGQNNIFKIKQWLSYLFRLITQSSQKCFFLCRMQV